MDRILGNSIFCDKRYALLLEDLERTEHDLDSAYMKLGNVTEPDLIDCYIYEVNAAWKKYQFLLKKAKEK